MSAPPLQIRPLTSIRRHPWWAIVPATALVAAAVMVVIFAPRKYVSQAKLFLKLGRESVTVDPTVRSVGDPLSMHLTREHEIESAIGVMDSREIFADVVEHLNTDTPSAEHPVSPLDRVLGPIKGWLASLDPVPADEATLFQLQQDFGIDANPRSSVVGVSYRADTPEQAQRVVAAWLDAHQRQHSDLYRNRGGMQFFEEQQTRLDKLLVDARGALRDAKDRLGMMTVEGGQRLIEDRIAELQKRLAETRSQLAAADRRVEAMNDFIDSEVDQTVQSETSGKANEGRDLVRNELFRLELQQQDLESRLVAGHPKLVAVARQIEQAKAIVDDIRTERIEITQQANPSFQLLQQARLKDRADGLGLSKQIELMQSDLKELYDAQTLVNANEGEIGRLTAEVSILEEQYAAHARRFEQAKMDEALAESRMTSIAVIQSPSLQYRPVSPNKPIVVLLGLVAAGICFVALPILADYRQLEPGRQSAAPTESDSDKWDFEARQKADDRESLLVETS